MAKGMLAATLPSLSLSFDGNAPVSLSKNLMTGPKFTQYMQDDINRQFEAIYMFRQKPEIYAMLLFSFYDQVQTDIHRSVRYHSAHNEQYKKYIAPIYETYNKNEAAFLAQLTGTLMPLMKQSYQTINLKFPVVFDNAGNNLATVVIEMQRDYPAATSIFMGENLKHYLQEAHVSLSKSDTNNLQFVQLFGKFLRRIVMENMPYAVEIARATYFYTRVQEQISLEAAGTLSPDSKKLFSLMPDRKVLPRPLLLRQHIVCHALYSCQSQELATVSGGPGTNQQQQQQQHTNMKEDSIRSFVNYDLVNSAKSLGTLPLLFVWPLLEKCLQDAGVFSYSDGQEVWPNSREVQSSDRLANYLRQTLCCPALALATQISAGTHLKYLQSWPPEFAIMGSDSALPLTLKNDLGCESTQHLLGRKMACQYSRFAQSGILYLCKDVHHLITHGYTQCPSYEEILKLVGLEARSTPLVHLMESPACRYMDKNEYFACTDEYLHLHATDVELNHTQSPQRASFPEMNPPGHPQVLEPAVPPAIQKEPVVSAQHHCKSRNAPPLVVFYQQEKGSAFPCKLTSPQVEKHSHSLQLATRMLNNDRAAQNLPMLMVIEQPVEVAPCVGNESGEEEESSAAEQAPPPPTRAVNRRKRKREDDNSSVSGESSTHENGTDEVKKTTATATPRAKRTKAAAASSSEPVTAAVKTRASKRRGK